MRDRGVLPRRTREAARCALAQPTHAKGQPSALTTDSFDTVDCTSLFRQAQMVNRTRRLLLCWSDPKSHRARRSCHRSGCAAPKVPDVAMAYKEPSYEVVRRLRARASQPEFQFPARCGRILDVAPY
jgi:hypothetical protein